MPQDSLEEKRVKKVKGLQKRWLRNTLSIVLALVFLCVTALSVTAAAPYSSNMAAARGARVS